MKRPNEPWLNAAEAIAEARAALVAAGISTTEAVDSPNALAGPTVSARVELGAGHIIARVTRWGSSTPPQWTAGLMAWCPGLHTRGTPNAGADVAPGAAEAMARTLARALGQAWSTDAEREALARMLARLSAAEVPQ